MGMLVLVRRHKRSSAIRPSIAHQTELSWRHNILMSNIQLISLIIDIDPETHLQASRYGILYVCVG